jgi:hypothetical protein
VFKLAQYPRNADGTPMDIEVGVLTDATGNGGARLTSAPAGPDGAPIDTKGLILVNSNGTLVGVANTVTPQQYYEATDPDFSAAMVRSIAALKAAATTGYGYGNTGSAKLFVPAGVYYLGTTTLDITHGIIIEGESVGYTGPGSTVLKWAAGTTGIRMQNYNTTGATGIIGSPPAPLVDSNSAVLRNLTLYGPGSGAEGEYHGVHLRCTAELDNVGIYNFQGEGVHIAASSGSGVPLEGNANCFHLQRVLAQGCRHGFFLDGADANAGTILGCSAIANRAWGFWDSSFLGNTFVGCHASSNGWDGAITSIPTACTYSGNRYFVKSGQATGASTNAPSGTTADNTWWGYIGEGGVGNGLVAWVSGTTFREGGSYKTDDPNNHGGFYACYEESDQNPAQIIAPCGIFGGFLAANNRGNAGSLKFDTGGALILGSDVGDSAGATYFDASGVAVNHILQGRRFTAGVPANIGSINFLHGTGNVYDVSNAAWKHYLRVNAADIALIDSSGIDLQTGKVLSYAGIPVVSGGIVTTASSRFKTLFSSFVDVQNTTTVETDIFTNILAAGELGVNGDRVEAQYSGTFVSSATATRQLKIKFAGTIIFDSGALTLSLAASWDIYVTIIRVSATVIRYAVSMTTEGAALAAYTATGELTGLTLVNTNILKLTGTAAGTGAATGDITGKLSAIDKKAA